VQVTEDSHRLSYYFDRDLAWHLARRPFGKKKNKEVWETAFRANIAEKIIECRDGMSGDNPATQFFVSADDGFDPESITVPSPLAT